MPRVECPSVGPPMLPTSSQDVVLQPSGLDRVQQPSVTGHRPDRFSRSRVAHSLRCLAGQPGGVSGVSVQVHSQVTAGTTEKWEGDVHSEWHDSVGPYQ